MTSQSLHRRFLRKPDGRGMWLYGRAPIDASIKATSPEPIWTAPDPHLRFHPLRGEWVVYAGHRQNRTFLPPEGYDPLAPALAEGGSLPTELPVGNYDIAVFENRYPSLVASATAPDSSTFDGPTLPARGACEVVVYAQSAALSLGELPLWNVEMVILAWQDRTRELGARADVLQVFPFENRGVEVGVTLLHPHGQLYAYPFVPPILARETALQLAHFQKSRRSLLTGIGAHEAASEVRVVASDPGAIAFVPAFARYAYELWVAPLRAAASLTDLDAGEVRSLATVLKKSLQKLDALFGRPMPYIMAVHQAPSDGIAHPEWHMHIEIFPALRMANRLKYLAGSEIGAGVFTADTLPEAKAAELRAVETP